MPLNPEIKSNIFAWCADTTECVMICIKKTWVNNYEPDLKRVEWNYTDSPVKKKFRVKRSVKMVELIFFYSMKGTITIDFLEKGAEGAKIATVLSISKS